MWVSDGAGAFPGAGTLMQSLGVFAEMMEKEFFKITRKVLGDGFQWDDAGFSQW